MELTDELKATYIETAQVLKGSDRRAFRPEFLNRVDATVVFRSLTRDEIKQIIDLEIHKVADRLVEHAIALEITEEARE